MKTVEKETLIKIVEEFPTFSWDQEILEELIDPKLGVITAFGEILSDIEMILSLDLGETGFTTVPDRTEDADG